MQVDIVEKGKIPIMGKVNQGTFNSDSKWLQDLWDNANKNFNEIAEFVKLDKDGVFAGFWGAMTDINDNFLPWDWQGKYMAGCEVKEDSFPPVGWEKWVIPAFRYAVVECNHNNYHDTIDYMRNDYLPKHKYKLVGAIQEFYDPLLLNGSLYLYFPIEVL